MLIFPALDLLGGRSVRLRQGNFARATVISEAPIALAATLAEQGATGLHVVDLDGARRGHPVHGRLVREISEVTGLPIQVGGGLRTRSDIAACLEQGATRVVLGTRPVEDLGTVQRWVSEFGHDRIVVALDLRGDRVQTRGWRRSARVELPPLLDRWEAAGVRMLQYTDVLRDGMLAGPNLAGVERLVRRGFLVQVAGGIRSADDLRRLRRHGVWAAIIGNALLQGHLTLAEAHAVAGTGRAEAC